MADDLKILNITKDNLSDEGICCAFSDKKHVEGARLKEEWLAARFDEGFRYKKLNVRGKVFIEYVPAEYAWSPIDAPNYLFIHCFWVSGRYKGQGWGKQLLNECLTDTSGKDGIVVMTGKKDMGFMVDPKFFRKCGFEVCDTAPPYFQLMVKRLNPSAPLPRFRESAKQATCEPFDGFTMIYSDLCPFTTYWVEQMKGFMAKYQRPIQTIRLTTREQAQNMPSAFAIFSLFLNGKFLTHEMMHESKFDKLYAAANL